MEKYNCIIIMNQQLDQVLMCLRTKNPYKGLYNLVGGKVEVDESDFEAAYRELFEETGIKRQDITLHRLVDFRYHQHHIEVQSYVGVINQDYPLTEEVNTLHWLSSDENFFDMTKFAGEGNIGHMIEHVMFSKEKLLNTN